MNEYANLDELVWERLVQQVTYDEIHASLERVMLDFAAVRVPYGMTTLACVTYDKRTNLQRAIDSRIERIASKALDKMVAESTTLERKS